VQEAASHADPRTTIRYDRARVSLDRHATYIVHGHEKVRTFGHEMSAPVAMQARQQL
jgi:hypothetical protein